MNEYNSNIYLISDDLNNIENQINEITQQVQYHIFNNTSSAISNIYVNADLNSKTLYLSFPINIPLSSGSKTIIKTNNNNLVMTVYYSNYSQIYIRYKNKVYMLFNKTTKLNANVKKFKLPYDFGTVTEVDTGNIAYQYIKYYPNENVIPNYVKHTWVVDEFLSMQKIDNIIKGINNISNYYFKPQGWINIDEWLKTSTIERNDTNMNSKYISYQDLNKWLNNLNLINFDDLQNMSIWNSPISQIDWDEENNIEWEDL